MFVALVAGALASASAREERRSMAVYGFFGFTSRHAFVGSTDFGGYSRSFALMTMGLGLFGLTSTGYPFGYLKGPFLTINFHSGCSTRAFGYWPIIGETSFINGLSLTYIFSGLRGRLDAIERYLTLTPGPIFNSFNDWTFCYNECGTGRAYTPITGAKGHSHASPNFKACA